MGDIVNLKDHRKRKDRESKQVDADAKRMMFGRTKGEKKRDEMEKSSTVRKLDGAKRERDEKED